MADKTVSSSGKTKGVPEIDVSSLETMAKAAGLSLADFCAKMGISKDALFAASMGSDELTVENDPTGRIKSIIMPKGWDEDRAIFALKASRDAKQKELNYNRSFTCIPVDGMVAFYKAMKKVMGFSQLRGQQSFFGERPPVMVQIRTGVGTTEQVPYCKVEPPAWEGGCLQPVFTSYKTLVITGVVKQKYSPQVDEILHTMEQILKEDSLYKGHAIICDYGWLTKGENYNPETNSPEFMDTRGTQLNDLVLNREVRMRIENEVWNRITQPEACHANGISLKTGLLLSGEFGTGKTLTARVTAKLCVDNGWTFIYLKTPSMLVETLETAKQYAPAVVFAEDFLLDKVEQ